MSKTHRTNPDPIDAPACDLCDSGSALACSCPDAPDPDEELEERLLRPQGRSLDRRRVGRLVAELETGWQDMAPGRVVAIGNTIDTIVRKNVRGLALRFDRPEPTNRAEAIVDIVECWDALVRGRATWLDVQVRASALAIYFDEDGLDAPFFFPDPSS